ncbi:hypothetical protein H696_02151 [Fonticula alba]|uniref:Uncharacterized protein n=1 Tax=Fonticula alba TaxID=691883 RepID=A0A058ZA68_FONAL|nr:hypothetical protein H696_02151 [Fonticula alba]KCV71199.1 hypothetical protein H696_02151 [Fonticula alba]|eukprot:XP_009494322.1 hypothetical protein H696_02151 [Fonticula alba]
MDSFLAPVPAPGRSLSKENAGPAAALAQPAPGLDTAMPETLKQRSEARPTATAPRDGRPVTPVFLQPGSRPASGGADARPGLRLTPLVPDAALLERILRADGSVPPVEAPAPGFCADPEEQDLPPELQPLAADLADIIRVMHLLA